MQTRVCPADGRWLHCGRGGEGEAVVGVSAGAVRAHHRAERLVVQAVLANVWGKETNKVFLLYTARQGLATHRTFNKLVTILLTANCNSCLGHIDEEIAL